MNRNPLIPFGLIMVIGLGLMFLFSFVGLDNMDEIAQEAEGGEEVVGETAQQTAAGPEAIYQQSCLSCHGAEYEGGFGPVLKGIGEKLTSEEIQGVLKNGKGAMPPGLVPADQIEEMAQWLSEL